MTNEDKTFNNRVGNAAKWSALGEVSAKLITPISTIILARILTPEAFGVVATITMVISFAEIFMDAGFQRYVIQREYESEEEKFKYANVAFWTNLTIGILMLIILAVFNNQIAVLVGNPGLGYVLIIAGITIPIGAMTSVQSAIFQHSLDFKALFYRKLVTIIVPLCVTVPLAFILHSYWALVIGTLTSSVLTSIILTIFSPWKPSLFYDWHMLQEMFLFSMWTLLDTILVWLTSYAEIFFIGIHLNSHILGLYKTARSTVGQFVSIISSSILPVLMPAFSRTQHDLVAMRALILKLQKITSILIFPIGAILLCYSHQLTDLLLGPQWEEAADFIGLWGVTEVLIIVLSRFYSYVFPAIGKPKISVLTQSLYLIVLLPSVYMSVHYGFKALYWTRTLVRFQMMFLYWYFSYKYIKLNIKKTLLNIVPAVIGMVGVFVISYFVISINSSPWMIFAWIPISLIVYVVTLCLFPRDKQILSNLLIKGVRLIKSKCP